MSYFTSLFPIEEKTTLDKTVWGAATLSSVLGIENYKEILGALLAHSVAWYQGGKGPSVLYNFLTGCRLQKKQYIFTVVPIAADVKDLSMPSDTQVAHGLSLLGGYLMSSYGLV